MPGVQRRLLRNQSSERWQLLPSVRQNGIGVRAEGLILGSDPVASNTTASTCTLSVGPDFPLSLFRACQSFHGERASWNHISFLARIRWWRQRFTATTGRSKTILPPRGVRSQVRIRSRAEGLISKTSNSESVENPPPCIHQGGCSGFGCPLHA